MTTRVTPELGLLAKRVAQARKTNRLFKRIGLILLALLGGARSLPHKKEAICERLRAERFLLKDTNGRIRADLSVDKAKNSTQLLLSRRKRKSA